MEAFFLNIEAKPLKLTINEAKFDPQMMNARRCKISVLVVIVGISLRQCHTSPQELIES